jgi:hypothetical protein
MAKQTVGSEIIEGLKEMELAGQIAQLLRPLSQVARNDVLDLTAKVLCIFDARAKAKPR